MNKNIYKIINIILIILIILILLYYIFLNIKKKYIIDFFIDNNNISIKKQDNTKIYLVDDIKWKKDFNDRFINHEVYSHKKMAELLEYLPNNSYIIDVGAHVGDTGLYLALILKKKWSHKNIKIIMIEPDITKINFINKMAKKNKLNNIITKNYSVSDKKGTSSIIREQHPGAWKIKENIENIENNENIKMDKIDNICKNMNISMMHIDVEGMEYKTLLGSKNILKNVKYIMIELNYITDRQNEKLFLKENNFLDITDNLIKKENNNHLFIKNL
jgi:FkbM family methyltransferase